MNVKIFLFDLNYNGDGKLMVVVAVEMMMMMMMMTTTIHDACSTVDVCNQFLLPHPTIYLILGSSGVVDHNL